VLDDGRTLMGLVVAESTDTVDVILPDATRAQVVKKQVEQRETLKLSPMPQGLVKTPVELRDILAYLLSDRPLPP
jgi:hypothetical protein